MDLVYYCENKSVDTCDVDATYLLKKNRFEQKYMQTEHNGPTAYNKRA